MPSPSKLQVTYTKSSIGHNQRQKDTVRALGLRRMHQTVLHDDTAQMRGMLHTVRHLVTVVSVTEEDLAKAKAALPAKHVVVVRPPRGVGRA